MQHYVKTGRSPSSEQKKKSAFYPGMARERDGCCDHSFVAKKKRKGRVCHQSWKLWGRGITELSSIHLFLFHFVFATFPSPSISSALSWCRENSFSNLATGSSLAIVQGKKLKRFQFILMKQASVSDADPSEECWIGTFSSLAVTVQLGSHI